VSQLILCILCNVFMLFFIFFIFFIFMLLYFVVLYFVYDSYNKYRLIIRDEVSSVNETWLNGKSDSVTMKSSQALTAWSAPHPVLHRPTRC